MALIGPSQNIPHDNKSQLTIWWTLIYALHYITDEELIEVDHFWFQGSADLK